MLLCVYMYYINVYSIFKCLASNDVLCNVLIWANKNVSYLDLYDRIPLAVALNMAADYKVRGEQYLLGSFSCTLLKPSGLDLVRY